MKGIGAEEYVILFWPQVEGNLLPRVLRLDWTLSYKKIAIVTISV